jgi:hypothetical protein
MRQVVDGATVFSRARAAAGRLLAECSGRRVSLLVTNGAGPSSQELALVSTDIASRLAEAEPGYGDGDPAGALARAAVALKEGGDCFLITDLARGSLSGVDPQALPAGVALRLIDAGGGGENVAVIGLSAEPGVAVAGRPVTVIARIANYSSTARHLAVNLRIGPHVKLIPLECAAGAVGSVQSTVTFDAAGSVAVEAELSGGDGDALPDDDRRSGQLAVVPAITTILVTDADRDDPAGVVRPLVAALTAAGLTPRLTDGAGLMGDGLGIRDGSPALVVTAGLRSGIDPGAALKAHLAAGGAWLQVVASPGDAALTTVVGAGAPAVLGQRIDVSEQERGAMAISQARLDHALLAPFQGREALLRGVMAYRYYLTPGGPAADAAVLWTYADGTIALCERPVGAGRWLELNCSPGAVDSTLGRGEVLPLIIARLPAALLPARNERLSQDVGSMVPVSAPVSDPAGHVLAADHGRIRLDRPGLYRVQGGALIAAAIPALESDLRRLDPALLNLSAVSVERLSTAAASTPLWPGLLVLLAAALATELLLAGGLGARPPLTEVR